MSEKNNTCELIVVDSQQNIPVEPPPVDEGLTGGGEATAGGVLPRQQFRGLELCPLQLLPDPLDDRRQADPEKNMQCGRGKKIKGNTEKKQTEEKNRENKQTKKCDADKKINRRKMTKNIQIVVNVRSSAKALTGGQAVQRKKLDSSISQMYGLFGLCRREPQRAHHFVLTSRFPSLN